MRLPSTISEALLWLPRNVLEHCREAQSHKSYHFLVKQFLVENYIPYYHLRNCIMTRVLSRKKQKTIFFSFSHYLLFIQ